MVGDVEIEVTPAPGEQPGVRPPAPGGLARVQALVNSADLEGGLDLLADASGAAAWLDREGVAVVGRLAEGDRRRLVELRALLRVVLAGHDEGGATTDAAAELNRLTAEVPLRVLMTDAGAFLAPAGAGLDAYLASLLGAILEATIEGTWRRLKVCRDDACRWAFYDHSKNSRGTWCTMRVCGSRAKSRAYRSRRQRSPGG